MRAFRLFSASATFATLSAISWSAAPVIDELVPTSPQRVTPTVGVGKSLIFPVTCTDTDGDVIKYTVTSSNKKVFVRARSGCPKLVLAVDHAAGAEDDPAYTGTMEFQLFRNWAPLTTGYIGGTAQSKYYENVIFHRLTDLNGGTGTPSFIFQGGDKAGTGSGSAPFQFDDEFHPTMTFGGRGQLAMANAGISTFTFKGSNGTQFFITDGQPRHLDFNHTIFAQMLRGWEMLPLLKATKVNSSSKPLATLKITSANVVPNLTDAVLMISATAPGISTITVTAEDGNGGTDTKQFVVTAVPDTVNAGPYLTHPETVLGPVSREFRFPVQNVDLERDYIFNGAQIAGFNSSGQAGFGGSTARVLGDEDYVGALDVGLSATQYDMTHRGAIDGPDRTADDRRAVNIGIGDLPADTEPVTLETTSATANTAVITARFKDRDARATTVDWNARINWGDATTPSTGSIEPDPTKPGGLHFVVKGTHTYANPGIYPLHVSLSSPGGGFRKLIKGTAIVTDAPIKPVGIEFDQTGAKMKDRLIAKFRDTVAPAGAGGYTANILWGDGTTAIGRIISRGSGNFEIYSGDKLWRDPDRYSILVRIVKTTAPAQPAYVWSTATVGGFKAPEFQPPYSMVHLVSEWVPNGNQPVVTGSGANAQAYFSGTLVVVNSGNKTSKPAKVRFFLSPDKTLNTTGPDPDQQMLIGPLKEVNIPPLPAGRGISLGIGQSGRNDFRIRPPKGENTSGMNFTVHLGYSDPIADHMKIDRQRYIGRYPVAIVTAPASLETTEARGTKETAAFSIVLLNPPKATVNIPISLVTTSGANTAEASFSPTSPVTTTTLQFAAATNNPDDWKTARTITIYAKDDDTPDLDQNYVLRFGAITSDDARYDDAIPITANGLSSFTIKNIDDEAKMTITPTSTTAAPLITNESATTQTITVKFSQEPAPGKTFRVPLTISDTSEGELSTAELTFANGEAITGKTFTVTGKDDFLTDGPIAYTVTVGTTVSTGNDADPRFNGIAGGIVRLRNDDNEPKLTLVPATTASTPIITSENGTTATFTVKYDREPAAGKSFSVVISVNDDTEGTASVAELVFNSGEAITGKTVTITGLDDALTDGPVAYTITISATTSVGTNGDPSFDNIPGGTIHVRNDDNE